MFLSPLTKIDSNCFFYFLVSPNKFHKKFEKIDSKNGIMILEGYLKNLKANSIRC